MVPFQVSSANHLTSFCQACSVSLNRLKGQQGGLPSFVQLKCLSFRVYLTCSLPFTTYCRLSLLWHNSNDFSLSSLAMSLHSPVTSLISLSAKYLHNCYHMEDSTFLFSLLLYSCLPPSTVSSFRTENIFISTPLYLTQGPINNTC